MLYLNNSVISGTNSTPQSLLVGAPANLPMDVIQDPLIDTRPAREHIQRIIEVQQGEREIIKNILRNRAVQAKQKFDAKIVKRTNLLPGMIAFWRVKRVVQAGVNRKLIDRNLGPFLVLKISPKGEVM